MAGAHPCTFRHLILQVKGSNNRARVLTEKFQTSRDNRPNRPAREVSLREESLRALLTAVENLRFVFSRVLGTKPWNEQFLRLHFF